MYLPLSAPITGKFFSFMQCWYLSVVSLQRLWLSLGRSSFSG